MNARSVGTRDDALDLGGVWAVQLPWPRRTGGQAIYSTGPLYGLLLDATARQVGMSTVMGSWTNIDFAATATLRNGRVIAVRLGVDTATIMGQLVATRQPS